jgi:hypothetical protein
MVSERVLIRVKKPTSASTLWFMSQYNHNFYFNWSREDGDLVTTGGTLGFSKGSSESPNKTEIFSPQTDVYLSLIRKK